MPTRTFMERRQTNKLVPGNIHCHRTSTRKQMTESTGSPLLWFYSLGAIPTFHSRPQAIAVQVFFCVCDWTTTQIIASKFQISRDIWADFHLVMTISNTIFVRFTIICYPGSMWWQLLSGRQGQVKSFQWPKPFVRRKPHACYRLLLAGAVLLYL